MNKIFRQFWKGYNNFSKGDRSAIIFLGIFILLLFVGIIIVNNIQPKSKYNYAQYEQLLKDLESPKTNQRQSKKVLFVFDPNTITQERIDTLDLPEFVKQNILNYRKAGGRFSSPAEVKKIYGMNDSIFKVIESFINIADKIDLQADKKNEVIRINGNIDPNNADFSQLVEFGFNRFQANNIIEYRKRDGFFKTKTDLLKIYGIDSAFFKVIENYIQIEVAKKSPIAHFNPVVLQVELNSADSTELMKINGIGSVYARRILKYRELLGGFYSTTQLLEVYNFPEETFKNIESSISTDTLLLKKIRVNFAEYADLLRHPYLNKKQVEAVLNYRGKNGSFQNILQLKTNGLIDSETFSRIRPYLTCR